MIGLAQGDQALKNLIRWNPLNYVNIWVVNDIQGGVAGYAYFPSSHGNNNDGIVIEANYMGTTTDNSKVLVHEMGHYLGLFHTFQAGCPNNDCLADGDKVCDTPPDNTTAHIPCIATSNSCTTDEDDLVADLNCGSGSTLIAANELKRNAWGCDVNKDLIDLWDSYVY